MISTDEKTSIQARNSSGLHTASKPSRCQRADNASFNRDHKLIDRMAQWYPNSIQGHTQVHASWLNQIEIYFSIVQLKL